MVVSCSPLPDLTIIPCVEIYSKRAKTEWFYFSEGIDSTNNTQMPNICHQSKVILKDILWTFNNPLLAYGYHLHILRQFLQTNMRKNNFASLRLKHYHIDSMQKIGQELRGTDRLWAWWTDRMTDWLSGQTHTQTTWPPSDLLCYRSSIQCTVQMSSRATGHRQQGRPLLSDQAPLLRRGTTNRRRPPPCQTAERSSSSSPSG